jgi:hypothetical protein
LSKDKNLKHDEQFQDSTYVVPLDLRGQTTAQPLPMDAGLFRQLLLCQARCLAGSVDGLANSSDAPNAGAQLALRQLDEAHKNPKAKCPFVPQCEMVKKLWVCVRHGKTWPCPCR